MSPVLTSPKTDGPIKIPATLFYAYKIAKYAVDNYEINPSIELEMVNNKLLNNLHFL
jgi:hypothetical protein